VGRTRSLVNHDSEGNRAAGTSTDSYRSLRDLVKTKLHGQIE
jgi:hypothetical protein